MPPVVTEQEKPASDPRTAGFMTKLMSKAFGRMTPDERTEMMQDAAALTSAELTKADNMMTVDSAHTGFIEDHWSDGGQDTLRVDGAHGPGSSSASGSVNVGPSQASSGNGAAKMEPEYSRYAAQSGLQVATEKLGRDLLGVRGAMKSILKAMEGFGTQLEMLKAGATPVVAPDATALQTMIETAVAKAVEPIKVEFQTIVSKAWDKKDEKKDDKEDDEDAKAAALVAKADDKEKDKEKAEEGDEKSASATLAAELRLMAKARITHAKLRLSKALDYAAEEKAKAAQRAMGFATVNLAKAQSHLDESTALLGGKIGLSTQSIALDIAKAKKGLAAAETANQDIWPATTEAQDSFGKAKTADPPAATETVKAPSAPNPDLVKAVAQIEAAATGMGMMTASVADLFKALSGQTKPIETTTSDGERHNMPPVFALAKAGASDLATREAELARLRDSNVISFEDHDHARDALTRARMGLPEETIKAMIARLPEAAKAVLTRSAA